MSYPGSFPGDPAGQQPGSTPGGFEYPPIDYGTPGQPPVYSVPPGGYPPSPQVPPGGYPPPQMPPGAYPPPPSIYPPPPQYNAYNTYGQYPPAPGAPAATNGMAIGSLVASLVGLPLFFLCLIGTIGSVVGIALGIVALNQVKQSGQKGKEMAIAGIAIGGVGLMFALVLLALYGSSLY